MSPNPSPTVGAQPTPIPTRLAVVLHRLALSGAVAAGLIAALSGLTWIVGHWHLVAFGADYVPMAPSTVLLMILLSGALVLRTCWPARVGVQRLAGAAVASVVAGSAILGAQFIFGRALPLEDLLVDPTETALGIMVGRMSPLTASSFLLAALGWTCLQPRRADRRSFQAAGTGASAAVGLIGLIIVLGYASGTPLQYTGETIPMAGSTALAFLFLGGGLLAGSRPLAAWISRNRDVIDPAPRGDRSETFGVGSLAFALLLALIATGGLFYLRNQQTQTRRAMHLELVAIAEAKVTQLTQWRQERLADAQTVRAERVATDLLREIVEAPSAPRAAAATAKLQRWMTAWRDHSRYSRVQLLDANLLLRIAIPAEHDTVGADARAVAAQVLRTHQPILSDLQFADQEPARPSLSLVIPLTSDDRDPPRPVGVLILQLDPHDFLYPLLRSWPVPSRTAEALIVRREGDEVLFLNDLRHRADSALRLRLPLNQLDLPAALALRGHEDVSQGRDYRAMPVVAVARAVPYSRWVLVAKIDQEEIYLPLRRQAWAVFLATSALLLLALQGGILWRRHHRVARFRRQNAELEQRVQGRTEALATANVTLQTEISDRQRAEEALLEAHRKLEHLVQERTGALITAKVRLEQEIVDRKRAMVEVRRLLEEGETARQALLGIMEDEKQAAEELRESREGLRALAGRLQTVREEERTRIAREIHDELGQQLTGLKMDLRWVEQGLEDLDGAAVGSLLDKVVTATELVNATIGTVQRISAELRSGLLDKLGLVPALRHEARVFAERTGLPCRMRAPDTEPLLTPAATTACFRVVQEALTNVIRHAQATAVDLEITFQGAWLSVVVRDNGGGIDETKITAPHSLGLLGMQERAHQAGAEISIRRGATGGTVLSLLVPCTPPEAPTTPSLPP